MSIRKMNDVWKLSEQSGGKLLLLLAIADFANDAGMAYPGIDTLAEKTRQSRRTVQRQISDLEEEGELAVEPGTGRSNTNTYWILAGMDPHTRAKIIQDCQKLKDDKMTPFREQKKGVIHDIKGDIHDTKRVSSGAKNPIKGDIDDIKGDTAMTPEPLLTVIKDSNININRYQPRALLEKTIDFFRMDTTQTNGKKIVALLQKCRPRDNGPGALVLQVPDPRDLAWMQSRLTAPIERILPGIAGRPMIVKFELLEKQP